MSYKLASSIYIICQRVPYTTLEGLLREDLIVDLKNMSRPKAYFSYFRCTEGHNLYETRIEKWPFRLE